MDKQNNQLICNDNWGTVAVLVDSNNIMDLLKSLKNKNIAVKLIEVSEEGLDLVDKSIWQEFSRVFIAINYKHKLSFGQIQGLLDILCLAYTGSGMLAVALSKDIIKSKKIWQTMGIATTPLIRWYANIDWQEMVGLIGLPLAIKSIDFNDNKVFKIVHMEQLKEVLKNFANLNDVIIEPWIAGDEYIVHIIDNAALIPVKISNGLSVIDVSASDYNNMQKLAMNAFIAIGCVGFAAVHILKDLNGDCWVLSINTAPKLELNSYFATAANNSGIDFDMLVEKILASSLIKKSFSIGLSKSQLNV